ncbi:hypothetical protein QCA50_001549 [Cerrena zonata]|uniref:Proteasome activator complex subunit 4 C-terminal domain-containing protein n=1 Tax=Cerrena zonata TaxID=2478898 RepID=A0AAW0GL98_9APHY
MYIHKCECIAGVNRSIGITSLSEPSYALYDITSPLLDEACRNLKACLSDVVDDPSIVAATRKQRIQRVELWNEGVKRTTDMIVKIGQTSSTHWKYSIIAVRCLRTLLRRDSPPSREHVQLFLDKMHDSNSTMRYYALRAIMKVSRFIKIRSLSHTPENMIMEQNDNPLRQQVPVTDPSEGFTQKFMEDYRIPLDLQKARAQPLIRDKILSGWLAWEDTYTAYLAPQPDVHALLPWASDCQDIVDLLRENSQKSEFWEKVSVHFSSENNSDVILQDNVSAVKSILQLLGDEPFSVLRPIIEKLLKKDDKNKQRGAAEFMAAIIGASKHWPADNQAKFWDWLQPHIGKILDQKSNDTLPIWGSFLEYIFCNRDPRRVQPIVDQLMNELRTVDFHAESTFDIVKILSFFQSFYQYTGWKSTAWVEEALTIYWPQLSSDHDDVLAYVSDLLSFTSKVMWSPTYSLRTPEVVVRESRTAPLESDLMGTRGVFHEGRVQELAEKFAVWRDQRLPGARAFQSTYDRVGIMVCRWLFQSIHDTNAVKIFDYIMPLLPEIFRFTEINDNNDLAQRSKLLLIRMCGVTPPKPLVSPILSAIFNAIQTSPSWRVRLKVLPLVQIFYFRQAPVISDIKIVEMMEVVCRCLDDEIVEVREMAATTLSGILRVSPRRSVLALKDRFIRLAKHSKLPEKSSPVYQVALRQRHAAVLGICALIDSYPYTIESWMPGLMTEVLVLYTYDPIPISGTVRKCASNFRMTHQDTWHEDQKKFTDEQLSALSTLLTGSSYYA